MATTTIIGGGVTFVDIATTRMENIHTVLDAVIAAENNVLTPILRALMVIYIGRQFLLCMAGELTMRRFFDTIIRSGIIILIVTHNGAFVQWIEDPIFNRVPIALSNMVAGNYAATAAGQPLAVQFDVMSAKSEAIQTEIDAASTHVFSVADWINSFSGHVGNGTFQVVLGIVVCIWLLGQTLLAIVLAMFLPMLLFELFDRTRSYVDAVVAKCIGFAAFGFATSFVLALEINQMETMFANIHGVAAVNAANAVGMLGQVVRDAVLDLCTMAVLPAVVGFGAGGAAALAAPSAFLAMRSLSIASRGVTAAASGARRAISRTAGTGGANSTSQRT